MSLKITRTIVDQNGDERELILPARFEICPACDGKSTSSRHVECDNCYGEPNGFTADEWAEQDDEFKEDYLAGHYDRQCETCAKYPGRVLVVDREHADPVELNLYDAEMQEDAEYEAMCRAERRMGA